uniref:Plasma membrane fusion protein PRM1 n=1 Tax=Chromera velia CCMP2878 TaxID=1169474 RepID=A0A0G4HKE9_9ALVE|eukprot:Cvel_7214.t1-p1 / transcript=Cvel_7214.t1 / gene=Cvel_7214 / organism=Chromera_velia_CCMP2878 / gene_product=hypothetical protein / transcript_product=hypothetical protein / location=Cvel_scaffold371:78123-84963(+) / protein_length=749 / sequence_SO=supercontig / SO=protein_coding / is_pseudo=false
MRALLLLICCFLAALRVSGEGDGVQVPIPRHIRRRQLRTDTDYTSDKDKQCDGIDLDAGLDSTAQMTLDNVDSWTDDAAFKNAIENSAYMEYVQQAGGTFLPLVSGILLVLLVCPCVCFCLVCCRCCWCCCFPCAKPNSRWTPCQARANGTTGFHPCRSLTLWGLFILAGTGVVITCLMGMYYTSLITGGLNGIECAAYTMVDNLLGGTVLGENATAADYFMGLTEARGNLTKLQSDLATGSSFVSSVDSEVSATSDFATKYTALTAALVSNGETTASDNIILGNVGMLYAVREVAIDRFSTSGTQREEIRTLAGTADSGLASFETAIVDGLGKQITNASATIDQINQGVQAAFYLLFGIGIIIMALAVLDLIFTWLCRGIPLRRPTEKRKFPASGRACCLWSCFLTYAVLCLLLGGLLLPIGVIVGDLCNYLDNEWYTSAQISGSTLLTDGQVKDIATTCFSSDGDRELMTTLGLTADFEFKDEMRQNFTKLQALYPAGNLVPYTTYGTSPEDAQTKGSDLDYDIDGTTSGDAVDTGALYRIAYTMAGQIDYPLVIMDNVIDGMKCGVFFQAREHFTNQLCGNFFAGWTITALCSVVVGYLSVVLFGVFYAIYRFLRSSHILDRQLLEAARKPTKVADAIAPSPQLVVRKDEEEKKPAPPPETEQAFKVPEIDEPEIDEEQPEVPVEPPQRDDFDPPPEPDGLSPVAASSPDGQAPPAASQSIVPDAQVHRLMSEVDMMDAELDDLLD